MASGSGDASAKLMISSVVGGKEAPTDVEIIYEDIPVSPDIVESDEGEVVTYVGGVKNFRRPERRSWTAAMVQILLEAFQSKVRFQPGAEKYQHPFKARGMSEAAAVAKKKLAALGHNLSESVIRGKWSNLCYQYRTVRDRPPSTSARWAYFEAMHAIVTNRSEIEGGSGDESSQGLASEDSGAAGPAGGDGEEEGDGEQLDSLDQTHGSCCACEGDDKVSPSGDAKSPQKTGDLSSKAGDKFHWSRAMVLTLVGVMKNYVPFGVGPERSEKRIRAFSEAAERLRGLGHTEIKSSMCSMKWSNMVKTYGLIREREANGEYFKSSWDFYDEMHEVAMMNENKPLATCRHSRTPSSVSRSVAVPRSGRQRAPAARRGADWSTFSDTLQASPVTTVLPGGTIILNTGQFRPIAPRPMLAATLLEAESRRKRKRDPENDPAEDEGEEPQSRNNHGSRKIRRSPGTKPNATVLAANNLCVLGMESDDDVYDDDGDDEGSQDAEAAFAGASASAGNPRWPLATGSNPRPHSPTVRVVNGVTAAASAPAWFRQWVADQAKERQLAAEEKQREWEEEKLRRLEAMHKEKVELLRELIQAVRRPGQDGALVLDSEEADRLRSNLIKVIHK